MSRSGRPQGRRAPAPSLEEGTLDQQAVKEAVREAIGEITPVEEGVTPTEVEEATPAAEEEEALIKAAVLVSVGLDEEDVEFMISTNTGTHAKGNIREVGAVGGGYWLLSFLDILL